ncbi:MAG: hypothetical protein RLZZ58_367 [Pseudomonadota bacterium]
MNRFYAVGAVCTAITLAAASTTHAAGTSPLLGKWATDDGKAIMEIVPCGKAHCARIARFLVPQPAGGARDTNNPDKALRNRLLIGVNVLTGLVPDGKVWKGKGYSPEEGRNFNATVAVNVNTLNLKGCVAVFCRSVVWKRAK